MQPTTKKLRWGVLGYARIARESLIPAMLRSSNSHFSALASRDPAKLEDSRNAFPAAGHRCYDSYEALLADPEIDAIYNPLPNSLHLEWTLKAAEAGKHILCEKPMGLNAAEARQMAECCEKRGVLLMEAFMYRFSTRTAKVAEILRSGVLGDIKFVESSFRFHLSNPDSTRLKPELGGGALYDVGCYPINFVGMVADLIEGGDPGSSYPVALSGECVREGGVDVIFSATLRYASGLVAVLNCGFNAHKRVHSEIIGTKGVLEIPDTFFDNAKPLVLSSGSETKEIPVEACERYRLEVESFAHSVVNKKPVAFGLPETLRNAEVLDALLSACP